jgi:flagellar basal-body rod modification protein FlgD
MTGTVASTSANQAGSASSQAGRAGGAPRTDYDTFLKLLTSQLKHQDPMKPIDSTQFVAQLAQFSQIEESIKTNSSLESLVKGLDTMQLRTMAGLIGKQVEAASDRVSYSGSPITIAYDMAAPAESATAKILNADGKAIRSISISGSLGRQTATWDGKDDKGRPVQNGTYTVSIEGKASDGSKVSGATAVAGRVASVVQKDGQVTLVLSTGAEVKESEVVRVAEPPAT